MQKVHELYKIEFSDGVKGALGIDEHGQLYWSGKPVLTEHKVKLPWWIALSCVFASLSLFFLAALLAWLHFSPLLVVVE